MGERAELIERLRASAKPAFWQVRPSRIARTKGDAALFDEAADALAAAEAEIDRLTKALALAILATT